MRVSFFKRAAAGQCQCNHAITAPGGGAAIALRGAGHPSYHLTVLVVSSRESLGAGTVFPENSWKPSYISSVFLNAIKTTPQTSDNSELTLPQYFGTE